MENRERTSETERRRGTALFIDISGFTAFTHKAGAEEAYRVVSGLLIALEAAAREYGGHVDKYQGDALMAMFGIPFAIENAPRAAVNAAIDMHSRVDAYNREHRLDPPLAVHAGIETGLMISGDVSGPVLREFAVMGDPVNIAARLKDRAPRGAIWVGPETHRATRDDFDFDPMGPQQLKGLDKPVGGWAVTSREPLLQRDRGRDRHQIRSALVGRRLEMESLRNALSDLRGGRGGILGLSGEAGTGKSRLIAELETTPEAQHVQWLAGRALPAAGNLSFRPFTDLLTAWLGLGSEEPGALDALDAALARLRGKEGAALSPFLASLMRIELDAPRETRIAQLESEAMERLTVRSMTELLCAIAREAPLVLVFDELHWADGSSVDLLLELLRLAESNAILFILVTRPGDWPATTRLREHARAEHAAIHSELFLDRLDAGSAEEMIENLLGGGGVTHATREQIERRTAGNPFFLEEVIRELIDRGALDWSNGRLLETSQLDVIHLPGSVQEVVMARIDRLDLATRRVLNVASVVGAASDLDVLEAVVGTEVLVAAVPALVGTQLVVESARRGRAQLGFHHPLVQEVAYQTLLEATRAELHAKVAETMESVLPPSIPGRSGMLAYHFGLGGDAERAEQYLFEAGDDAARLAASSEALHFFREASRLFLARGGAAADPLARAALEKKISMAYFNRGQFLEANAHFDQALELLGERVPRTRVGAALSSLRALAIVLIDIYHPRSGALATPSEREQHVFDLMFSRARAEATTNPEQFFVHSMEGLRRLRGIDLSTIRRTGITYAGAGGIFAWSGLAFGVGARFLDRARRTIDTDDPHERFFYRLMHFAHAVLSGDWQSEEEVEPELVSECLRDGQLWEVTTYLGLLQNKQVYQGRFREAAENVEELAKLEELYGYALAASNRQFGQAILMRERRRLDEALEAAEEYLSQNDETSFNMLALGTLAELEVLRGDLDAARHLLERARDLRRRVVIVTPFHENAVFRARFACEVAALERAPSWRPRLRAWHSARIARRRARRLAWDRPIVARMEGARLWVSGRHKAALRAWSRARIEAESLAMRPELARIEHEIGRRLQESGGPDARFEEKTATEWIASAEARLFDLGLRAESGDGGK